MMVTWQICRATPCPSPLATFEKLHGKELSYNNLLDLDSAMAIVREFDLPAAVVIKHNNPCGCAIGNTLTVAFEKASAGDPVFAFHQMSVRLGTSVKRSRFSRLSPLHE